MWTSRRNVGGGAMRRRRRDDEEWTEHLRQDDVLKQVVVKISPVLAPPLHLLTTFLRRSCSQLEGEKLIVVPGRQTVSHFRLFRQKPRLLPSPARLTAEVTLLTQSRPVTELPDSTLAQLPADMFDCLPSESQRRVK